MRPAPGPLLRPGREGPAVDGGAVEYPRGVRSDLGGLHDHLSPNGSGIRSAAPRASKRVEDTGGPFPSGGLISINTSNGGGITDCLLPSTRPYPAPSKVKSRATKTREETRDLTLTDGAAVP